MDDDALDLLVVLAVMPLPVPRRTTNARTSESFKSNSSFETE